MLDRNGRRQRRSELGDAAPPQPRALQLPEPAAEHSGTESDGAVAAANNAGDDSDEYIDFYDDGASDTEHVPSRLSTLGFD